MRVTIHFDSGSSLSLDFNCARTARIEATRARTRPNVADVEVREIA